MAKHKNQAPRTAQVIVPALGQVFTVRAVTWDEVASIRAAGNLDRTLQIIALGTVSPALTAQDGLGLVSLYGERPLIPVIGKIIDLSGFTGPLLDQVRA